MFVVPAVVILGVNGGVVPVVLIIIVSVALGILDADYHLYKIAPI